MLAPPLSQRSERPHMTFITEMKNAQRYNVSQKSNYTSSQNKTPSMLPSLNPKKSSVHFEEVDQCKLDHIYELLAADIHSLKNELMPMRIQYLRLKDHLLFQSRCAANSKLVFSEQAPSLSEAIGEGTFSVAIGQFQEQSNINIEVMTQLRQENSNYSVIKLACQVDAEHEELEMMKNKLKLFKEFASSTEEEILEIKRSNIQNDIQEQKEQIQKLFLDVTRAENRNTKLSKMTKDLEKEPIEISPENHEAFEEVQKLNQVLSEKRQAYFQKCNQLIELRNKQLKEIQEIDKAKSSEQNYPVAPPTSPRNSGRKPNTQQTTDEAPTNIETSTSTPNVLGDDFDLDKFNVDSIGKEEISEIPLDPLDQDEMNQDIHYSDPLE